MNSSAERKPPISAARFDDLISRTMPAARLFGIRAERIVTGESILRLPHDKNPLGPNAAHGSTSMMAAIDLAMYAAVLSVDPDRINSSTTLLSVSFLRRPPPIDLLAACEILSMDDIGAVGRCTIYPHSGTEMLLGIATCACTIPAAAA